MRLHHINLQDPRYTRLYRRQLYAVVGGVVVWFASLTPQMPAE
jgi:hypothetical protein